MPIGWLTPEGELALETLQTELSLSATGMAQPGERPAVPSVNTLKRT